MPSHVHSIIDDGLYNEDSDGMPGPPGPGRYRGGPPLPPPKPPRKKQHPQKTIDEFWNKFTTKYPGKAFTILPDNLYAKRVAAHASTRGAVSGQKAVASYEMAKEACIKKVKKIADECRRVNQKYRDPHFDIERDFQRMLKGMVPDCLYGLAIKYPEQLRPEEMLVPKSVKRVEDIFEDAKFYIEGPTASDVRQGADGDCWFMSALCTLSAKKDLIERICVERDEKVGVYGFVFHRDGEWISEVIDDKLYLIKEDFEEGTLDREKWLELQNRRTPAEEYKHVMQTGSQALYFAQCSDENETWLPLLEKAYAKAHGDYQAISGGFVGEGIEDLTGGVTTELFATDILDKDKFWTDEIMKVNQEFLFGCGQMGGIYGQRQGILEKHAYSIMEARELHENGKTFRLVKVRNPWGNTEWTGPWSDGSKEWTPKRMEALNHEFGDDGLFWIEYKDLLRTYQQIDRTRLFGKEWNVTQQWTSLSVPWSVDYLDTKFKITLKEKGPVVIVLSQLDDRYFRGLEGQYNFQLQFRLHEEGKEEYIVRSHGNYYMKRSVSTELELDKGNYYVLLKIIAKRYANEPTPDEVIRDTCNNRREKLLSIGLSYDLAHAKGQFKESEREKRRREKREWKDQEKKQQKKAHEQRRRAIRTRKERAERRKKALEGKLTRSRRNSTHSSAGSGFNTPAESKNGFVNGAELTEKLQNLQTNDVDPSIPGTHSHTNSLNGYDDLGITRRDTLPRNIIVVDSPGPGDASKSPPPPPHPAFNDYPTSRSRSGTRNGSPPRANNLGPPFHPRPRQRSPSASHLTVPQSPHNRSASRPHDLDDDPAENTDDDISWNTDLHYQTPDNAPFSSSSSSDGNPDAQPAHHIQIPQHPAAQPPPPMQGMQNGYASFEEEDEFEADPWNAVCVVGLRVFSKGQEVGIEVFKEDEREALKKGRGGRRLDVDDSAVDATVERGGEGVEGSGAGVPGGNGKGGCPSCGSSVRGEGMRGDGLGGGNEVKEEQMQEKMKGVGSEPMNVEEHKSGQ